MEPSPRHGNRTTSDSLGVVFRNCASVTGVQHWEHRSPTGACFINPATVNDLCGKQQMTITLFRRWLVLLALVVSLPPERGCNCGTTTSTPRKPETPRPSDVPFVIVYSESVARTDGLFCTTAEALATEFPDLRATLNEKTGQFQLWAPQTVSAKVEARLAALAAENAKLAADGPRYLTTYPLGGLDATATFADLTQQFPGVTLDIDLPGRTVYVKANRETQLAVTTRLDSLKSQNSPGNVPHDGN